MTQAVAKILEEAEQLSPAERAELADRLVESLAHDIPLDIAQDQIAEVRRRIAQAESGEVALIPGEETAYLMRSPANAKRLLEAIHALESGKGVVRDINLDA
jgi:putative addiction module component (TIGR02574 family)